MLSSSPVSDLFLTLVLVFFQSEGTVWTVPTNVKDIMGERERCADKYVNETRLFKEVKKMFLSVIPLIQSTAVFPPKPFQTVERSAAS